MPRNRYLFTTDMTDAVGRVKGGKGQVPPYFDRVATIGRLETLDIEARMAEAQNVPDVKYALWTNYRLYRELAERDSAAADDWANLTSV